MQMYECLRATLTPIMYNVERNGQLKCQRFFELETELHALQAR